jgi:hypothetical protein
LTSNNNSEWEPEMGISQRPRVSPHNIRARTASLHEAAGKLGDPFLQYLYQMALLHLDELAGLPIPNDTKQSKSDDPNIALAARLVGRDGLEVPDRNGLEVPDRNGLEVPDRGR